MGHPSELRFVPASISATPIDWTRVPEASKKFLIEQYGYDCDKKDYKPLPATIEDLAKMFDYTKFFSYLTSGILTVLLDISKFGLRPKRPAYNGIAPVGPRFYMACANKVWFFLFAPGTRECIWDHSDEIINDDDDDDAWEKMVANEAAMAQAFDVRLEEDISRGMAMAVEITNKLSGWTAMMAQSTLEYEQYADVVKTLPYSH